MLYLQLQKCFDFENKFKNFFFENQVKLSLKNVDFIRYFLFLCVNLFNIYLDKMGSLSSFDSFEIGQQQLSDDSRLQTEDRVAGQ